MDIGLNCLVVIARFHQLPVEQPNQLAHEFVRPGENFSDAELLLAAKSLALRENPFPYLLRILKSAFYLLLSEPFSGGSLRILEKITRKLKPSLHLHDLREEAQFSSLLTNRHDLAKYVQQKFDISLLIPLLVIYCKLFSEVIIVSFFLQIFALKTLLRDKNSNGENTILVNGKGVKLVSGMVVTA